MLVRFSFFSGQYCNNVILKIVCVQHKTLSTSLSANDFISQYKLFISLRSWKVILTWNKALLWSSSVIPRGGWLFVFMISWQQTPLVSSVVCLWVWMRRHTFVSESECVCLCLLGNVFLRRAGRVCASACLCVWTDKSEVALDLPSAPAPTSYSLCLCCVCRLQGMLILEYFFFSNFKVWLISLAVRDWLKTFINTLLSVDFPFSSVHAGSVSIGSSMTTLDFEITAYHKLRSCYVIFSPATWSRMDCSIRLTTALERALMPSICDLPLARRRIKNPAEIKCSNLKAF